MDSLWTGRILCRRQACDSSDSTFGPRAALGTTILGVGIDWQGI